MQWHLQKGEKLYLDRSPRPSKRVKVMLHRTIFNVQNIDVFIARYKIIYNIERWNRVNRK